MPHVLFNAFCAIMLIILQTNVIAAFGIGGWFQFGVIAASLAATLGMPIAAGTLSVLVVALFADYNASGPPGIYAFVLVVIFLILRMAAARFKPQRIFVIMIYAALATVAFEAALAVIYRLYYGNISTLSLFANQAIVDAIATALFLPIVATMVNALARLWQRRRQSELS